MQNKQKTAFSNAFNSRRREREALTVAGKLFSCSFMMKRKLGGSNTDKQSLPCFNPVQRTLICSDTWLCLLYCYCSMITVNVKQRVDQMSLEYGDGKREWSCDCSYSER